MPGSGRVAVPGIVGVAPGSGEIMIAPVSVCHHVSTIGHFSLPIISVIPHPRFGIDRLADSAEQPKGRQIVLERILSPHLMNAPDRRRGGVKDRDLVPFDHLPKAVKVGIIRRPFVHKHGRAVRERPVNDVAVSRDPADIGRAPINVVVL